MRRKIMSESIEVGQLVFSPSFQSFESFYILQDLETNFNATNDTIEYSLGHAVAPYQYYLACQYYRTGETNVQEGVLGTKKSKIDNITYLLTLSYYLLCPHVQVMKTKVLILLQKKIFP